MKKIISLFLVFVIMTSKTVSSFAADEEMQEYCTIQVEYSDNIGRQESLDVMIRNNNVFVNAKMLAERLGYTFGENSEGVMIYNKDLTSEKPFGITQFQYNSTKVSHMLFNNMIDTYEAPFSSIKNSEGSWIPFEYSLFILNSGMMLDDNVIIIDIPTKKSIDHFCDIAKNSEKYNFDWADDFGYTEKDIKVLGNCSHLINVFNGILGFDGDSWLILFQQFSGSMSSYDKKYGKNLAMFLCTESDKELQATIAQTNMLVKVLNEEGSLGQLLSSVSAGLDSQVGELYKNCEDIMQKVKNGNTPLVSYNRSYQALEKALNRQTWFSNTGEIILDVQKGLASTVGDTFDFLKIGTKVLEVVGYEQEFQKQDQFSLVALVDYLGSEDGGKNLPNAMKKTMRNYANTLSSSLEKYAAKQFFENNINKWITDNIPMNQILGNQAIATLFVWDIASNVVPFISNGLSGADKFELTLYSLVFQNDTFLKYLEKRNLLFSDTANLTAENMYEISKYCYIYLKSCYVTREAALASLENRTDITKEKIQPLIDYQNNINMEIAKMMVGIKDANNMNEKYVFGFLPSDNEKYLSKYDDSKLIQWVEMFKNRALSESELLAITEMTANHAIEDYRYIDMDHDGAKELIGIYHNDRGLYQTWYCSSDGRTCTLVYQTEEGMDESKIELLDVGSETHVVLNTYRMMGTGQNYSIIGLKNKKAICLISEKKGYVSMTNERDITLNVEAYDGVYEPGINGMMLHTWKDTYLFFDGNQYKEYGAIEISENEFLAYQNSREIKEKIEGELSQSNTTFLEFSYFRRKNGILHIQCNVHSDSGQIQYGYYTVRYVDKKLNKEIGEYNSGQMTTAFSDLEVVY